MIFLSTLLLAVLITISTIPVLSMAAKHYNIAVDLPGERKVHTGAVPRIGGIAMAIGVFGPIIYWLQNERFLFAYLAASLVIIIFGALDDIRDLSPKIKFAGQIIAALIVFYAGDVQISSLGMLLPEPFNVLPPWASLILTLLAIVGATNAINLSDGLDGLAGGICILIFSALAYISYLEGQSTIGLISLALAGSLFGFLKFNTHPATIFMGDAGSQFLGFSAATLSISLSQNTQVLSQVMPLLLLGFPILDTLTVMVSRITQGRSPFSADKNHFHHHLLGLGMHHSESVVAIYFFQTVLIISAIVFRYYPDWMLLGVYVLFSGLILYFFDRARRNNWRTTQFKYLNISFTARIRMIKRNGTLIKRAFPAFVYGVPLLLISTCLMAKSLPMNLDIAALALAAVIVFCWVYARKWLNTSIRVTLYLLIPFAVYLSETRADHLLEGIFRSGFNTLYGLFAVLILIISKFSRRSNRFRSSPMDFLIIIIAVAVPNLPNNLLLEYQYGLVAAKIIMLYFCFEVLLSELRNKDHLIAGSTVAMLLVMAYK